jgi:hypothetical protein
MVKLITPVGMLVTVALLAVYAIYSFWTAYTDQSWPHALLGLLTLVACVGTALLRAWSQYLVYALTAFFVGGWLYSVYVGAAVGFFSMFIGSPAAIAKSLAPGIALVILSCAASWISHNHFRASSNVDATRALVVDNAND